MIMELKGDSKWIHFVGHKYYQQILNKPIITNWY